MTLAYQLTVINAESQEVLRVINENSEKKHHEQKNTTTICRHKEND